MRSFSGAGIWLFSMLSALRVHKSRVDSMTDSLMASTNTHRAGGIFPPVVLFQILFYWNAANISQSEYFPLRANTHTDNYTYTRVGQLNGDSSVERLASLCMGREPWELEKWKVRKETKPGLWVLTHKSSRLLRDLRLPSEHEEQRKQEGAAHLLGDQSQPGHTACVSSELQILSTCMKNIKFLYILAF